MPAAQSLAPCLQRFAQQRLGGGEVAPDRQQHQAEVVHVVASVCGTMPIAERLALPLQRLAKQRLGGGEVVLGVQQ